MSLATTRDQSIIKGRSIIGVLINIHSIAFIEFDTSENAQRAKQFMHEKLIEGRELSINVCDSPPFISHLFISLRRRRSVPITSRTGDLPVETTTTWAIEEEAFSLTTIHPPRIITRATEPKEAQNSSRCAPRPPTETTKVVVLEVQVVIHTLEETTTFPAQTLTAVGIISEREATPPIAMVEAAPATTEVDTLIAEDTRAIGLKGETAGVLETIEPQLMRDQIATLEEGGMTRL